MPCIVVAEKIAGDLFTLSHTVHFVKALLWRRQCDLEWHGRLELDNVASIEMQEFGPALLLSKIGLDLVLTHVFAVFPDTVFYLF